MKLNEIKYEPCRGWGIESANEKYFWLWKDIYDTKKEANNAILKFKFGHDLDLSGLTQSERDYVLKVAKKEWGLKVVPVELVSREPQPGWQGVIT